MSPSNPSSFASPSLRRFATHSPSTRSQLFSTTIRCASSHYRFLFTARFSRRFALRSSRSRRSSASSLASVLAQSWASFTASAFKAG